MDQVSPSDTLQADGIRCHGIGPLSLSVRAGECLCISGASGSGKSLLLRSIADMEPHEGSVTWRGTAAETLTGPQWRRQIGLLPAESEWWGSQVSDHFPDASAAQRLPEVGLPTAMWQARIRDLSTGERQRLALIRLLANQPQVLLLDEPTASLDPESTRRIESLIRRYQQEHGSPIIWVSHDPEQITRVASRHLRLDRVLSEMKRS